VMVIYLGSEYSNVIDIGNIAQERTLEFEVGLRIRDLGWAFGGPPSGTSPGAYQVLEAIRGTLTGFQPNTGCTRMRPLRERFVERDRQGGVWVYAITFQTHTLAVENYPAPNFPLFVRGTAQEEGGQTTVAVTAAVYSFVTDSISFNVGNVSAVLVQSADRSQTYTLGTDYAADRVNGIVTRLLSGAIAPGATVAISYAYGDVVTASASGGSAPLWPQN